MSKGKRSFTTSEVAKAVSSPEKLTTVESPASSKKRKVSKAGKGDDEEPSSPAAANDKAPHIRDSVNPLTLSDGNYLKIMSWNVNGLKAVVTTKKEIFDRLVERHQPDILCLQETKLQENLVADFQNLLDGYDSYWSCSTVKKGYSGTVSIDNIVN